MFRINLLLILSTNILATKAGFKRKHTEEKDPYIEKAYWLDNNLSRVHRIASKLDALKQELDGEDLLKFCRICAEFTQCVSLLRNNAHLNAVLTKLETKADSYFHFYRSRKLIRDELGLSHKSLLMGQKKAPTSITLKLPSNITFLPPRQYGYPDLDDKTKLELQRQICLANMRAILQRPQS